MSKLSDERIDEQKSIWSMSYNVPGHKEREKALRERVQREYFDKGLNHRGRPKKE